MARKTVWAVEFWDDSHWSVATGGLSKAEASRQAKAAKAKGYQTSIAEYPTDEGTSAIRRQKL
jgi:hypothetical protein